MEVIYARNVNDAYSRGLALLRYRGCQEDSRAGKVLVMPGPVTTVYHRPLERVLFNSARDANPFFHLMEALWMLNGQRNARWLDQFVSDFSQRFAEEDGMQHGAYGYRWRKHFDMDGGGYVGMPDQLNTLVEVLRQNPGSRQAVLGMWDPTADLGQKKKDLPCNTHAYFRVREQPQTVPGDGEVMLSAPLERVLDLTVCCRSNDIIWGAFGANAVHFSVLQEYMAARIGVKIGVYYQISNNYHAYLDVLAKMTSGCDRFYTNSIWDDIMGPGSVRPTPLVTVADKFDTDLSMFFGYAELPATLAFYNRAFPEVIVPMYRAYKLWRGKDREEARKLLNRMPPGSDWRAAAEDWMDRRLSKVKSK